MNQTTVPADYPILISYITVRDAARAIAFYRAAFGAEERFRLTDRTTGKIGHAEILIRGVLLMLNDENPAWGNKSPQTVGGTPFTFCLMVENADAALDRAVAAGATVLMPAADQFYGFRSGSVQDPFGYVWMLQHEIEKVSPDDMQKRWDAMCASAPAADADSSAAAPVKITVETLVQAPLAKVWAAWTEPAHIVRWNAASDTWHTPRAQNDLRVGGGFNYRMEAKDGSEGFDFEGRYLEVLPSRRIVYTTGDDREVVVEFREEKGATRVVETFVAETIHPAELQRAGWQSILENFRRHVEAGA
jgi:uncharacterized glyoxalase superfamily protein PhnB/uncharacterized protein YndB with AHSA1/START domain